MKSKGYCKKTENARHQRHLWAKFDNRLHTRIVAGLMAIYFPIVYKTIKNR